MPETPDEAPQLRSILDRLSALAAQGPVTLELQSVFGCALWFATVKGGVDAFGESLEEALKEVEGASK